jgi:hypothetical protein
MLYAYVEEAMTQDPKRTAGSFAQPEVERSLLGSILENSALISQMTDLNPEDFAVSSYSCIFRNMLAMAEAGATIDVTTVVSRLESRGELEHVGGHVAIGALIDGLVIGPDLGEYAQILKNAARRRNLARDLEIAAERTADPNTGDEEVGLRLEKLSAAYRESVAAERKVRFRTAVELAATSPDKVLWVARPWVAVGAITLAIGKVKSAGKTTFSTHLVKSALDGAPFMGMATTQTPVVYLSEQSDSSFRVALQRAGLLSRKDLRIVTWSEASRLPWADLVRIAIQECTKIGAQLLVIDTIGQFTGLAGDAENNAGDALRAMQPLQQAAAQGIGVLVTQHERKSGGEVEDSGRGSSAFAGAADIVLTLRRLAGHSSPNLRAIRALSRFDETPDQLVAELTGAGYVVRDQGAIASEHAQVAILAVIPASESEALTMDELCAGAGVKRTTGQDAVLKLVQGARLFRIGKGHRNDPYRYFAPEIHSAANAPYIRQKETAVSM